MSVKNTLNHEEKILSFKTLDSETEKQIVPDRNIMKGRGKRVKVSRADFIFLDIEWLQGWSDAHVRKSPSDRAIEVLLDTEGFIFRSKGSRDFRLEIEDAVNLEGTEIVRLRGTDLVAFMRLLENFGVANNFEIYMIEGGLFEVIFEDHFSKYNVTIPALTGNDTQISSKYFTHAA